MATELRRPARTANHRIAHVGLIARIVMGGLSGACITAGGGQGIFLGAMFGAVGGVVGCFKGFQARAGLVKALGTRDLFIALLEDLVAIGGCLRVVSRF